MKPKVLRDKILNASHDCFLKQGYGCVSVDDIATDLKISKKTIYNYFPSKKVILMHVIEKFKKDLTDEMELILNDATLDFDQKLRKNIKTVAFTLSKISTQFIEDLQKSAPELWVNITAFKKQATIIHFGKLITEGTKQGKIKKDINISVAILIYMAAIENLLNPAYLKTMPVEITKTLPTKTNDIYDAIVKILYEGMLADEATI